MPDCEDEEVDHVTVPDCYCPISPEDFNDLECTISPSVTSLNYGIDVYTSTLAFVEEKMSG